MERKTLIAIGACLAVGGLTFGWLLSYDSLPPLPKAQLAKPVAMVPDGQGGGTGKTGEQTFKESASRATGINNVPVHIVISPGSKMAPIPVRPGLAGQQLKADLIVTAVGLNMRSEPSSQSEMLGNYSRGARFVHIRDEKGWALVQSLDDGQKGWMFKKFMGKDPTS